MPHCIIEYSKNIESQTKADALMKAVYQGVQSSDLFEKSHIRVRALAFEHTLLAGDYTDFIHVTLRLHQGRSADQKELLSGLVLSELLSLDMSSVSITVELIEMDTASYKKHVQP